MSCFGGHDEQIYLIEILIDKLTLTPDKIKDIGDHGIAIKIKFADLPVFEFTRENDETRKSARLERNATADTAVSFMIGRACLFAKRPRDLVQEVRSTDLKVGVFRTGDTYPTAETDLKLPGCLCDQIAMVKNDADNKPRPFEVKGGFHLLDPGGNPSGTLHIEFSVTCLGRVLATRYELHAELLASGERHEERQLCLKRFLPRQRLPVDAMPMDAAAPAEITQAQITPKAGKDKAEGKDKRKKGGK